MAENAITIARCHWNFNVMRIFKFFLLGLSLVILQSSSAFAHQPLEKPPLKDRVEAAEFVFVGIVEEVFPVDDLLQKIPKEKWGPEPGEVNPRIYDKYLFQVRVEEAISPTDWHPANSVYVYVWGAYSEPAELQKSVVGNRDVYLTTMSLFPHWGQLLWASRDYFASEPLEKKAAIIKLLKSRKGTTEKWNQFEWLARCLKDAEAIQPGKTREDVEKTLFQVEVLETHKKKYVLRKCPYITLEVEFETHDFEREADKVIRVSKPYLQWVATDNIPSN
jgi:hypothetical protein